jgi:hypothetical protein
VKISGDFLILAVKCQAMENTYSKNSSVIPGKFNIYRSCELKHPLIFSQNVEESCTFQKIYGLRKVKLKIK